MGKLYAELIRMRFLTLLAYRVNYYSGIIIYGLNIGAYYFLWSAIYGDQPNLAGLSVAQMTSYVAIAWMSRAFYFNNIDQEIAQDVRDGKVAIEMIRPYNYLSVKTAQALGEGIFRMIFFALPGMVLVSIFLPLSFPPSLAAWGLYLVSLLLAFIINTEINLLTGVLTFFLFRNEGMMHAKRVVVDLLSGLILPISFFPLWAQTAMGWLPFQAINYYPSMIFTGAIQADRALTVIGIQLIWVFVILLPIWLLWTRARRRLIVQGG
ncbi:daunorubicin ABC transporter permease [Brevibacillus fluminis]|uniref:Daunorubicin ABC transporter permease n=1 Tax=Brevibacillus fluminis TaxID=511487 RepID=A0A3M8DVP3_9BACL|nr:ABC-2 family transporter protein [Brevibacillus fluminis]RNB92253.1 daunorubicin ABC transporter permease [Brevibacillus fluminis]